MYAHVCVWTRAPQIVAAEVVYFYHLGDGAPLPLELVAGAGCTGDDGDGGAVSDGEEAPDGGDDDVEGGRRRRRRKPDDDTDDDDALQKKLFASRPTGWEVSIDPEAHAASTPLLLGRLESMAVREIEATGSTV